MTCCGHCQDAGGFFGDRTARRELRRYRRRGPPKSTRLLIEALLDAGAEGRTLLDVGGGVGAIQHELFANGLDSATHVDASRAYLDAAREEANERGHSERTRFEYGDFVALTEDLPETDMVTLDRVVCCYPDCDALLGAATERAERVVGLVYPRERIGTRVFMTLANVWFRLRGSDFRVFLHSPARVQERMRRAQFELGTDARTLLWRVEVWARRGR